MILTIKLFANFRNGRFEVESREYPAGTSVESMVEHLGIPVSEVGILMLNGRHVELDHIPKDQDVLAIFPLLGGG